MPSDKKIGLVICPNLDGWHETPLFVSYIIYSKIIDDPNHQTCLRILKHFERVRDVEVVYRTCIHCRRRGCK